MPGENASAQDQRLQEMLRKCFHDKAKLKAFLQEVLPYGEPPYVVSVFVGIADVNDGRKERWKEIFGADLEYCKCYLMMESGALVIGTVSKSIGDKLEPGQLVLTTGLHAVVEAISETELKNVVTLYEGVIDQIDGGTVMISDGHMTSRAVIYSNRLKEEFARQPLEAGDTVLLFGPCIIRRSEKKKVLITTKGNIRKVTIADIGGLEKEIQEIRDVLGVDFPEWLTKKMNRKFARGCVLYGPPGCGKGTIMAALANELGYFLQVVNGAEIEDKFLGEEPRKFREAFNLALKNKPAFLFIDEADAIFPVRGSSLHAEYKGSVLSQFNTLAQGIEDTSGVFIVMATNRIDKIDPAAIRAGRTDRKVFIPRPNRIGGETILNIYLRNHPIGGHGDEARTRKKFVAMLVEAIYNKNPSTALFTAYYPEGKRIYYLKDFVSGALLENIANEIVLRALKRITAAGVAEGAEGIGVIEEDLAGVALAAITQEIPQDDRSRNEWLITNGYRAAQEFRSSDALLTRKDVSKPRT